MKALQFPTSLTLKIPDFFSWDKVVAFVRKYEMLLITLVLTGISLYYFFYYLQSGLGLSYNDARSHLDIGRRVVEGLKTGAAQLGSVWLPLGHVLMVPLIWNDWMWHSGFAGAVWNMLSFVGTGVIIAKYLLKLKVGLIGRLMGVTVFAANINILYLQATAMTEPLLLFAMTAGCYYLMLWHDKDDIINLVKSAFWIMLATLTRYDGWFLLAYATGLITIQAWRRHGFKRVDGTSVLFLTLAALGVVIWLGWNQLIFGDALYFALGPFSAHAQQLVMEEAGSLPTKGNVLLSMKVYLYALLYNSYTYPVILAAIGLIVLLRDKTLSFGHRLGSSALLSPLFFNILALVLGFSVIFVQGISGDTWFNVRYGIMLAPTIAIFIGYLIDRARDFRPLLIGSLLFILFFAFGNHDSVSIDDARVGSSQKNVSEVAGYLNQHAKDTPGFILISAASHDAIIFSSGLPMKKFIHEGTGKYWESATTTPDNWARWIVMRTYDDADLTWHAVSRVPGFANYHIVATYPFATVYELNPKMISDLETEPVITNNK
jgi:hypothetical protein